MPHNSLLLWICWAVRRSVSRAKGNIVWALLWVIRRLWLRFDCHTDGLTYKWVAGVDGAFDHWFEFKGQQRPVWTIIKTLGFWPLIVRLLTKSEFLVGAKRRIHKEQILSESESYYCGELMLALRKSIRVPDLLEQYWKEGCKCREDSLELCDLCRKTEPVLRDLGYFTSIPE